MQLPSLLLDSLVTVKGFDRRAFVKVHESGEQITSIRINPFKSSMVNGEWSMNPHIHHSPLTIHHKIPWCDTGYYLDSRPSFTFDPVFHAGCYYVQEASSMFLEQALKQTVDLSKPIRVLDLCAAPGGKSTHLLSIISKDSLLVSNEVIRSRASVLNDNIIKWGCSNTVVTNNDPKDFQLLKNYFDVVVVDAPCSGSGLFRREPEAIVEWSEQNVALCCHRQKRILADVLPALKPQGVLIYSTCSYSREENEEIAEWLNGQWAMGNCQLAIDNEWGIVKSGDACRFWPDKVKGEGFFIGVFRKKEDDGDEMILPKIRTEKFSKPELDLLNQYVNAVEMTFYRHGKSVHAVRESLLVDIFFLNGKLKVINAGIRIGEIIRNKLLPDHALAMSHFISEKVPVIDLDHEQAIRYLKKKDLDLKTDKKGWSLVNFENHPLGWINILPNRINNYYPKELRILKD